jgi:hypothetical protein
VSAVASPYTIRFAPLVPCANAERGCDSLVEGPPRRPCCTRCERHPDGPQVERLALPRSGHSAGHRDVGTDRVVRVDRRTAQDREDR